MRRTRKPNAVARDWVEREREQVRERDRMEEGEWG